MVKVPPTLEQTPPEEKVTARPELAVAATVKLLLKAAVAGAGVVTVIVWLAWFTVKGAVLLVVPGPLSVAVMGPVVLVTGPVAVAVTFTEMAHEPEAAMVPALRLTVPVPAVAVVVPLHVLLRPFDVETTRPEGSKSEKAMPLRLIVFGLLMVKLRLVLALNAIGVVPNALVMVGGLATVMIAEAVLPVPPFVEVTAPVVLFFTPEVVPVTFTMNLQMVPAATVPPLRLTLPLPAVAVVVPPHVLLSPFGVATTSPPGNVSVKATPFSATVFAAGLVMVNVKLVVPFTAIVAAPNALLMLGGVTTDSVCCAEAVPADAVSIGPPALVSL